VIQMLCDIIRLGRETALNMGLTSEGHLALSCNSTYRDRSIAQANLGCDTRPCSSNPGEMLTNLRRVAVEAREFGQQERGTADVGKENLGRTYSHAVLGVHVH
jgi:hypothetical protein